MQTLTRLIRILAIVLATAIVCLAVLYFSIPMTDMPADAPRKFDVILVLGNPAKNDGTIAPIARERVLEAIRQYRAGAATHLLMTGGHVQNQFVESLVMQQFAIAQGVPPSAVFTEGESQNTIQNAYYSYKIMQAHDWTSVMVVSSPSHLRRASLIFMHYPLAWQMVAARWPSDYPRWKLLWFWTSEIGYTCYARFFGFPNAKQYLPHTRFTVTAL